MKKVLVCLLILFLSGVSSMATLQPNPTANANTMGFWHCDSTETIGTNTFADTPDDQTGGKTTNNLMRLGIDPAYTAGVPSLVAGYAGNALSFDGVDDQAISVGAWQNNLSTLAVDFWFKPSDTETGTNVLVEASSSWSIAIGNSYLSFTVWHPTGGATVSDAIAFVSADGIGKQNNTSTWYHVTATSDAAGLMSLTVNGTTKTLATGQTVLLGAKTINLGNKPGNTRNYAGLIDEVYVGTSLTPEPATLAILGLGALLLRRRK